MTRHRSSLRQCTNVLVSGDRRLREIDHYAGIRILTPREFLDYLDQEPKGGRVSSAS